MHLIKTYANIYGQIRLTQKKKKKKVKVKPFGVA